MAWAGSAWPAGSPGRPCKPEPGPAAAALARRTSAAAAFIPTPPPFPRLPTTATLVQMQFCQSHTREFLCVAQEEPGRCAVPLAAAQFRRAQHAGIQEANAGRLLTRALPPTLPPQFRRGGSSCGLFDHHRRRRHQRASLDALAHMLAAPPAEMAGSAAPAQPLFSPCLASEPRPTVPALCRCTPASCCCARPCPRGPTTTRRSRLQWAAPGPACGPSSGSWCCSSAPTSVRAAWGRSGVSTGAPCSRVFGSGPDAALTASPA